MKKLLLTLGLLCLEASADYGEQPLRGNLTDKPFGQTEGGREDHRFASSAVNQYRIYDFYARQARWHLEHPEEKSDLLLPFTGLDGGRRGHWGVTNEPATTAKVRDKDPVYGSLTERGFSQVQALKSGSAAHPALILFGLDGGLQKVLLDARIHAPGNGMLRHKVDIYGFDIRHEGYFYLQNSGPEWQLAEDGKSAGRLEARFLHGEQVVFRHRLGECRILDLPGLSYDGISPVLHRHFECLDAAPTLLLRLPRGAKPGKDAPAAAPGPAGSLLISVPQEKGWLCHLVWSETPAAKIEFQAQEQQLLLSGLAASSRIRLCTWASDAPPAAEQIQRLRHSPSPQPSSLTRGGPARLKESLVVKGRLNADPAAARGSYQIDDIPVPVDNPWELPMCLSGIAFDAKGRGFVCSLTGDVWRLDGLDADLAAVTWTRVASGLNQPVGLLVDGDSICICTRFSLLRLRDLNGDGEFDQIDTLNQVPLPAAAGGAARNGLGRDAAGNFTFGINSGIYRLAADGQSVARIGPGSRNPFGFAMRDDGLCLSDGSEGESENGCCTIFESEHPENLKSPAKKKRILYLPRGIDNSCGSRVFVDDSRFGPLGHGIVATSFGAGSSYVIFRDPNEGAPQAALMPLPGDFASGTQQIRLNPADGQLYTVGLDGWGDYAVAEGCLHRLRWNGKPALTPVSWQAHKNGLLIRFNEPVKKPDAAKLFAQQWNNIDSIHTYGSADYSVKAPGSIGHDRLAVAEVSLAEDGKALFVAIPELLPAMVTQIHGDIEAESGRRLRLDFYATLNRLRLDFAGAAASRPGKPDTLVVPTQDGNGNTYQNVTEFFDKAAGRNLVARPVAPAVAWKKEELNYQWIKVNLIDKQCIFCHAKGMQHDLSTYAGLKAKLDLAAPRKSHLYGMVATKSMPPYPMPTVAPEVQQALLEWIAKGAPEK
ncbi:MAG: hypothetical protein RL095_3312 [Verrucomicrobiota bacterium]|jgi:hypothetical protein